MTGALVPMTVEVDHELAAQYRRAAAKRDLTVKLLICELLEKIAQDSLVDAIMDDDKKGH